MTTTLNYCPSVSIVLPAFNGERFLASAIESVLAQTCSDWELLIVDDGSSDASGAISDDYASKDSRILVFHQPNGGVNSARAKGIDYASGEYLTFLDADDTFSPDALEKMLEGFSDRVDVVYCGTEDHLYTRDEYIHDLWKGVIRPGVCTKMFRSFLFKQMDYALERRLVMGEDILLNSMYALHIQGARSIAHKGYRINTRNEASVTKTFKHNWEYEKFFFKKVDELFLHKCMDWDAYESIRLQVNKCWLNAMKYVMLDGGSINYHDAEFSIVQKYFRDKKEALGPSEKLIFILKNSWLYRMIIRGHSKASKKHKRI